MAGNTKTVTVIGLGLMGSAIARAFGQAGYQLTVWNRTREKAAPLAGLARTADSVEEACAASSVIVLSLLNYEVSDALLQQPGVQDALRGKFLIQLTTGTPAEARKTGAWAAIHDILYLDGAIMTYPSGIGSEQATILYSGSRSVFDEHLDLLRVLNGNPTFCGEDLSLAATLDLALVGAWFGATAAVMHAAALCAAEAAPVAAYADLLNGSVGAGVTFGLSALAAAQTGAYPSGNSTMITNTAGVRLMLRASEEAGIDASYPRWLLGCFTKAIERGHGEDDIESLYEAFRAP
jgi:3-hydroxyisobutyrate dehydrogenase-like beta-hydroxyacid dehydrogenase